MIKGISHTGLVVQDIDKQVTFYRDVIGLKIIDEKEIIAPQTGDNTNIPDVRRKLVFLRNAVGKHSLELIYYIEPPSPTGSPLDRHQVNAMHLCFEIENLQAAYKEFSEKGVRFLTPPKVIEMPKGGSVCLCYAQDPEGNWLEFIEELPDG